MVKSPPLLPCFRPLPDCVGVVLHIRAKFIIDFREKSAAIAYMVINGSEMEVVKCF